jgi:hypothetical protein
MELYGFKNFFSSQSTFILLTVLAVMLGWVSAKASKEIGKQIQTRTKTIHVGYLFHISFTHKKSIDH